VSAAAPVNAASLRNSRRGFRLPAVLVITPLPRIAFAV
jgi:hypothetical protein